MLKSKLQGTELVARKFVRHRYLKPRIWGDLGGFFFPVCFGDHKTLPKYWEIPGEVINSIKFIKV